MATLHRLITLREQDLIDFQVWPQEGDVLNVGKHIVVESYPAMYPEPASYGDCQDEHCQDAWKVLQWIIRADASGTIEQAFELAPRPFGRFEDISFEDQVRFEGWMFGVS